MDVFDTPEEVWEDVDQPVVNGWTEADEIWDDIPPVRHGKYKVRKLKRNELAPIMLERIIAMSTNTDEIVMDPFGGSGTTYYAAEKLGRRWVGIELGDVTPIIQRLEDYHNGEDVGWESARRNMSIRMRQLLREFSEASGAIRECSLVGLSRLRLERVAVSVCL